MVFRDLFIRFLVNIGNQRFKAHDAALPCLKGLAVLAVHRAKAQKIKLYLFADNARLFCAAEYLFKMHVLTLINDVNQLIRIKLPAALNERRQIRRRIEGSTVRL